MLHHIYIIDASTLTMMHHIYIIDASTLTMMHHVYIIDASTLTMMHHVYIIDASTLTMTHHIYIIDASTLTMMHQIYIIDAYMMHQTFHYTIILPQVRRLARCSPRKKQASHAFARARSPQSGRRDDDRHSTSHPMVWISTPSSSVP